MPIAIENCQHVETRPAEQKRWRYCYHCEHKVHRSDTAHYRELFVPPLPKREAE